MGETLVLFWKDAADVKVAEELLTSHRLFQLAEKIEMFVSVNSEKIFKRCTGAEAEDIDFALLVEIVENVGDGC